MNDAFGFVFGTIRNFILWLQSWSFLGVSFLYWMIALAIVNIILDRVF